MSNYIDLVGVQFQAGQKTFLFYAPAFSRIQNGSKVVVDTRLGEQPGTVVAVQTTAPDSDEYNFAVNTLGARLPLKRVLSIVRHDDIVYPDMDE